MVFALLAVWTSNAPCGDFEVSGFVDASWVYNTADRDVGEFGVDKVELSLRHRPGNRTYVRTDLEWIRQGEDEYRARIEQTYMQYTMRGGVTFTFGRYNTPFGFEEYDAPDLYEFSSSLIDDQTQKRQAITVAPSFALDEGLDLILEMRMDLSDRDAWEDRNGKPTDRSMTIATELLFTF